MDNRPVILFDGVCNLCNNAVKFVIRYDARSQFLFASLQSDTGQKLLQNFTIPPGDLSSFVLLQGGKAFARSTAALQVVKQLSGGWKLLYGFIIVPVFIRDGLYRYVAANRYKWFGKQDTCMIPTPALASRFLA